MPPNLVGDETRVRQILFNLVGNAVKFTESGAVQVDAMALPAKDGDAVRVLFAVSDTGIGISDEQLQDIFEPFVQGERSYTRCYQGAGLGLAIVRKLVRILGGEMVIDNTVGNGVTVYVSLPFKLPVPPQEPAALQPRQADEPAETPLRVLLVEDDEFSLFAGQRMLRKMGYATATAPDGREALVILHEQDFDLVLMDVQMPVMDGVEATKVIRGSSDLGEKSRIPIIAMTAYAMAGDKERFLAAGMDGYISKPVDKDELQAVIEGVLEKTSVVT
jgi:CheY-like chemotaxis protein